VTERLYRFLLRLYPAHFRDEYAGEMARLFRDRCRREGLLRVCLEIVPDLVITAWREHMDTLRRDILYSLRALVRNPGFSLMALATLALGIGANTAIFSVVKGVLLEPLPYREPARLVELYEKRPRQGRVRNVVSAPDFVDWKKQATVFEDMAALSGAAFTLQGENGAELIRASSVSVNFLRMLGITPRYGRDFLPEEEMPGKNRVVILGHSLWSRRFGADPKIVGQKILLTGEPFIVVGVLADITNVIRNQSEIWRPLTLNAEIPRSAHFLDVFARLKPGVTLARARAEMDTVAARLEQQYANENSGHGVNVFTLDEEVIGDVRPALFILLAAVGLVLLIACANVANLYLARTAERRREISIRTALGAGTGRLVRQLLTEGLLVSLLGGAAGVGLAAWGVRALVAANPGNLPRLRDIRIDGEVLFFTLAISLFTGLLLALAPALYSSRIGLGEALKEGGRGGNESRGRSRVRSLLVVSEIALALMLAIGAGLMLASFDRLSGIHPGFDAANVLTIDVALSGPKYSKGPARAAFFNEYLESLRPLPGVVALGATTTLPLTGRDSGSNFVIEGAPPLAYAQQPNGRFRVVTPGYFETMRIPVRAGRPIAANDTPLAPPVLVVNATLARQFWPNESPLGKRIALSGETKWREIVGVVGDVKHYALDGETRPEMYFPLAQEPSGALSIVVRTANAPENLAGAARRKLAEIDKSQPIAGIQTLEEVLSLSVAQPRLYSALLAIFSTVALLLAAVGIYGVMSYGVRQRKHELGVRMALGARAGVVQAMVLREGLRLAVVGAALGIAGAFAFTRVLGKMLHGIAPTDPATFAGAALLVVAVAAAACYLPARRATRVDPMIALRSE
jgi:putative ABC transport system permease protein